MSQPWVPAARLLLLGVLVGARSHAVLAVPTYGGYLLPVYYYGGGGARPLYPYQEALALRGPGAHHHPLDGDLDGNAYAPYASRYAASALPVIGGHVVATPAERMYVSRGRPAIIPTPYSKYSPRPDDKRAASASVPFHPNSLKPEPGFYGSAAEVVGASVSDFSRASVGFYGTPLRWR